MYKRNTWLAVYKPNICSMALDEELVTDVLEIIHEMMTMSKDMLSMLKATIEVVNRHQEQLVFLHHQNSLTEQKKKEVKEKILTSVVTVEGSIRRKIVL